MATRTTSRDAVLVISEFFRSSKVTLQPIDGRRIEKRPEKNKNEENLMIVGVKILGVSVSEKKKCR
jgi:hypothetical protein